MTFQFTGDYLTSSELRPISNIRPYPHPMTNSNTMPDPFRRNSQDPRCEMQPNLICFRPELGDSAMEGGIASSLNYAPNSVAPDYRLAY